MVSASVAAMLTNLDELKWRLNQGEIACKFEDQNTKHYNCYLDGNIRISGIQPAMIQIAQQIEIPLICVDPRQYLDSAEAVGFTTATAMPMGTAKVEPSIDVSVGTFTLTYSGGATLSVSGAASPPITVDMANKTITNSVSASVIGDLTTGNFFSLDPNDGNYTTSTWPTLATSAGSGTANYNKAYL
jgi:phage-related protein